MKNTLKYLKNFCNFLLELIHRVIHRKELYVTKEVREQRLEQCRKCESYKHGRCMECGCFVKPKSKFIYEMCLKDRWE